MHHKHFISFSRTCLTSRGSSGPPLTSFSASLKFFVRIHRKNIQLRKKWAMLRLVLLRSNTQIRLQLLGHCAHDRLAHGGRVSQRAECLCNASRVCQPCRPVSHCLERVWEPFHEILHLLAGPSSWRSANVCEENTDRPTHICISKNSQMNARCRNARVCSSSSPSESIGDSISNNGFEFSASGSTIGYIQKPFRQVKRCRSTFSLPCSSIPFRHL